MADYYYATVIYPSGDEVRHIHKGKYPGRDVMAFLGKIGALIQVGEPLPHEKQAQYERLENAHAEASRPGWHPQMDVPEGDDE